MSSQADHYLQTACNLCFVNCGLKVQLGGKDGREIVKVKGDEDHPTSKGYICNKAARINYYQNNAARLRSPMRRRPDGSYEEIEWETAIAEIAGKFAHIRDTHGGERIFYYGGGAQGDHLRGAHATRPVVSHRPRLVRAVKETVNVTVFTDGYELRIGPHCTAIKLARFRVRL